MFSTKAFAIIARSKGKSLDFLDRLIQEDKHKAYQERACSLVEGVQSYQCMESERVRGKLVPNSFSQKA
ncbi:hypothetical protein [Desulfonatronovibrio magnus]|uniref:hypothetical protein n=1 Tax=Desulfonatronovibrio magnus TaxID=698827 RepID=UPI0005EB47A6|nr:hypothetical protein [Desulfonatronovibrio magnus]